MKFLLSVVPVAKKIKDVQVRPEEKLLVITLKLASLKVTIKNGEIKSFLPAAKSIVQSVMDSTFSKLSRDYSLLPNDKFVLDMQLT